ncbi:4074_t:CDS:1, partial [Racocetra persica]
MDYVPKEISIIRPFEIISGDATLNSSSIFLKMLPNVLFEYNDSTMNIPGFILYDKKKYESQKICQRRKLSDKSSDDT